MYDKLHKAGMTLGAVALACLILFLISLMLGLEHVAALFFILAVLLSLANLGLIVVAVWADD